MAGAATEGVGLNIMGVSSLFAPESAGTSELPGASVFAFGAAVTTVGGVGDLGGAVWQGYETGNWRPAVMSGVAFSASYVGGRWIAQIKNVPAARLLLGANADMLSTLLQGGPEEMSCPVN